MSRIVATLLLVAFSASAGAAQTLDLPRAVSAAVVASETATAQLPSPARRRGQNRLLVPGLTLVSIGVAALALAYANPVEMVCVSDRFGDSCQTHASKPLVWGGLGTMTLGAGLLAVGQLRRSAAPLVILGHDRVAVMQRLGF